MAKMMENSTHAMGSRSRRKRQLRSSMSAEGASVGEDVDMVVIGDVDRRVVAQRTCADCGLLLGGLCGSCAGGEESRTQNAQVLFSE